MKKTISIIGVISIFVAIVLLFGDTALAAVKCENGTMQSGVCFPNTDLPKTSVYMVINAVLVWISFIFASLAIITLIICGFMYLFSAGDDAQAGNAKKCITWSIVGIVVAGGAFIVIKTISQFLLGIPPIV